MLSLSSSLLLVISDKSRYFPQIRQIVEKNNDVDRKVLWSTLERLVKKGFIKKSKKEKGTEFSLTSLGKKYLPHEPEVISRPKRAWDNKWRMVIFDIPETKRKIRTELYERLKKYGFGRMQNSVYITPHDCLDDAKKIIKELKITDKVKVMLVENLYVDDLPKMAEDVWHISDLNKKYQIFVKKYQSAPKKFDFSPEILKYWLTITKFEYLSIVHDDPVLPKELLPLNWTGYKAQEVWDSLEKILQTY